MGRLRNGFRVFVISCTMDDSPWGDVPSQSQSDIQPESTGSSAKDSGATNSSTPSKPTSGGPRPSSSRKVPARKIEVQPTKLEAVDDSLDPLGPLGAEPAPETPSIQADQGPTPPRKELSSRVNRPPSATSPSLVTSEYEDSTLPVGRPKGPPPVQPQATGAPRQTQPSVSVEQAAKPTFDISVGDPHKVGDLTSSHIVYQVRTKTTSKAYKQPEFAVSRRYRDFLWLYNAHPILHHDADLKIFLESEAFNIDVKNKENREPDLGQNKGMLSSLGINVGGSSGKFVEHDDWFHDRKVYL